MMNKQMQILAMVMVLINASAYAAKDCCTIPAGSQVGSVFTEQPWYTIDLFASALFLKPTAGNLNYAIEEIPEPEASPNWNVFCLKPSYKAAFDIGFRASMCESDATLLFNWQRFRSSTCAGVDVGTDNVVGPFFEVGPDAAPYSLASGHVKFSFDEINLDFGKLVRFGDDVTSIMFGGLSFVRIEECVGSTYVVNAEVEAARTIQLPISFKGAGPQVGIDTNYCVWRGLSLTGKAVSALLVGRLKNHTTYNSTSPLAQLDPEDAVVLEPNIQRTCVCDSFGIVPAFEQKIGAAYTTTFCSDYVFTVAAGYQVQAYIGAIQSVDVSSLAVEPPVTPTTVGVFARTFHKSISNFALAGPYLTFDFAF